MPAKVAADENGFGVCAPGAAKVALVNPFIGREGAVLENVAVLLAPLKTLKNYRVAGVLLSHAINSLSGKHVKEILGSTPLVQFDRVFPDLPGAKIVGANCEGAYKATMHLIESGYKKIGTLAGFMTSQAYVERLAGYRMALEASGLPYDNSIVFYNTIVRETGYEAALKAIEAGCDALYSSGAFSALGAVDALREKGFKGADEFGIVATSNEGFTALMSPSLSTLNQHPFEMGEAAARAFLEGRVDTQVIPMELIIRQSSNKNNKWLK